MWFLMREPSRTVVGVLLFVVVLLLFDSLSYVPLMPCCMTPPAVACLSVGCLFFMVYAWWLLMVVLANPCVWFE